MVRSCLSPNSTNLRSSVGMSEWSRSQAKLALSACLNGLAFSESRLDSLDFKNRDGGRCSKQLRLVEVDPEEHCRAQGDDENSPAELQQCIARVASMRNLWDGQHCSRDSCCLGCSVLWCSQRSLTAKGGWAASGAETNAMLARPKRARHTAITKSADERRVMVNKVLQSYNP